MACRQIDQKHVSSEVALMEWSPTMDLIALATKHGEIVLHRLSWQKVWSLRSPGKKEKSVKVTSLAWRPDGKVLAFAYDTGNVLLCDVENSEVLHSVELPCCPTALSWVGKNSPLEHKEPTSFYNDRSALFLPKLPSLSKSYGTANKQVEDNVDDSKKLKGQNELNILAVGTASGMIHLYAFGIFLSGVIDLSSHFHPLCSHKKILSLCLSEDLSLLSVVAETRSEGDDYIHNLISFRLPLLLEKTEELKVIALKFGQISSLLAYLSSTIHAISEAWEDILLEIDSKLMNYAEEKKRVSEGTISDDFLELLMFGTPSDILEKFLLHDLTEKGLKKLGHSIELSYSNIQKLVLKHLQSVASALFYHLSDLKGMAMWQERFGELNLLSESVNQALFSVGSFLMKATEIQQVIDNSMKNFKAFFRWLYAVILRLSEEPVPAEITKVTQQDLNFVAEFLKENFTSEWDQDTKSTFKLERVGQYLKEENLSFPPVVTSNPWIKFLEDNPSLKESDIIIPYYPEKSLVQQHSELCKMIETAFSGPSSVFEKSVSVKTNQILCSAPLRVNLRTAHTSCLKSGFMYSTFIMQAPNPNLYIVRENLCLNHQIEAVGLSFGGVHNSTLDLESSSSSLKSCSHKVIDAKFYNEETLSVLLHESETSLLECSSPCLVQLPLKGLLCEMYPVTELPPCCMDLTSSIIDGSIYIDKSSIRKFENISASSIAVSGSRKVACVLLASKRQVRLLEMDVDDDEEDGDDTEHEDCTKESFDKGQLSDDSKIAEPLSEDVSMLVNKENM